MSGSQSTETRAAKGRSNNGVVMPDGHLPAFDGEPILASCKNCGWCTDQSDGYEYGPPWYTCEKKGKEHMSNLKGFPFKTAQKCCELDITYLVDWAAEARKEFV
ncbi:hypothetical protein MLD52_09085 [Puniceicoccaceae bacterium K14]|nr:hypothetical protein [Puniceicoccaceae bacterium K14]